MSQKLITVFGIFLFAILLIAAFWALTVYYANLPSHISQHETLILGQNRFVPGSQAALRVVVRDSKDAAPLPGAQIQVSLRSPESGKAISVFQGVTSEQGTADVVFRVPADAASNQTLVVETKSRLGKDEIERPVTLQRDFRILLSTDKPVYQPGQVIHLRALALSSFDLTPAAGQGLEIVIADGKGNKVFRKQLTTSDFGVAATDFQLASEVNTGPYKISATLNGATPVTSERTVNVENYVLPKFSVDLSTERPFYLPGEHVKGSLRANYFFGKPVAGGQVQLEGFTFDVQRNVVLNLQGTTDVQGDFPFEFDLPAYIAGSDLEGGQGTYYLQASVVDQAQHTETSNLSLPVAQHSLVIEAVPEGGRFRPGVDNILYLLTSYPDGSPAETDLTLDFMDGTPAQAVHSGEYGLAEVHVKPQSAWMQLNITARDARGNTAQQQLSFDGENSSESVLLRPDKPVYRVGDTMKLSLLTSALQGNVYLDIVRSGQTVSTRSIEIANGHAEAAVDLTPDLFGTLELHAYKLLPSGEIVRDTRLVVVDSASDLKIALNKRCASGGSLSTEQSECVFRPGETAGLDIQVDGQDGKGVQSAVGLSIVDESVFALAEQDPGFAKLYFMLEKEIMQPRYDLHGFSVPDLLASPQSLTPGGSLSDPQLQRAVEDAAQASLAAAVQQTSMSGNSAFSLQANSHQDAIQRADAMQQAYFQKLSKGMYAMILLLPLTILGLSLAAVAREKRLTGSLALMLILALAGVLLFFLWPLGENQAWMQSPLERLGWFVEHIGTQGEGLVLALALSGLLGYLGLIAVAWRGRDALLGSSLALVPLFMACLVLLAFAANRANLSPSTLVLLSGVLACILLPLGFLLRFGSFAVQRRLAPALAALLLGLFLLVGTLPALALAASSSSFVAGGMRDGRLNGGPMIMEDAMPMAGMAQFKAAPPALLPAAAQAPANGMVEAPATGQTTSNHAAGSAVEPPRLRQYFPETMFWLPDGVTNPDGSLHLDLPVADSITTWRMTALASTQDGRLGSTTAGLRVFQDFFIDLDLPQALTVGDEVSVPVGVFNYLAEPQSVRLELEQADWFELLDEPVKEITIEANDISVVYFRVRARAFGTHPLKVTALGAKMSDAIQKDVRVFPDGKPVSFTHSDRLTPGTPVQQTVNIPADAVPGTQSLVVKVYPGILSQVVEGLDSILRMPSGCFEQTSSTTYPNVLVLDYLKSTNQVSPETQMKAEEYINLGYQRLTTFEVQGSGGFSLFGNPPADRMLTAYGLQEFGDMSRIHDVDPALLQRAAEWLLSQQQADGSWENDQGLVHENTWSSLGNDRLPVTAYIVWSLIDAGFDQDARTQKGLRYVREFQEQAKDPYVVALVSNALVAGDLKVGGSLNPVTTTVLDRLAGLATMEGNSAYWKSSVATFMGSEGQTGSIETSALAALAFLRANSHPDLGNAALTYLVQQKDSFGTWHSTQATVLALKALIQSVRTGAEKVNATVTITLDGGQAHTLQVTPENFDVVQMVSFDDINPGKDNLVNIQVTGEGNLMYQVAGGYYLPWDKLAQHKDVLPEQDQVSIDVAYDRTDLAVNDTVNVDVTVSMNKAGRAESALIDLGLPPGFSLQTEDLDTLVNRDKDIPEGYPLPVLQRYELTGRQILVYVGNLSYGNPLHFSYHLKAKYPLMAQTPASSAYDYYNPDVSGEAAPQTLVVRQ